MKAFQIAALPLLLCALSACDDIKSKLHLMPNQDAQQCIDGERLKFKDPDVLFVANLGDRGLEAKPDQYWVRYKAKNSYGAYLQGNMLCSKDKASEKWKRDTFGELTAVTDISIGLLKAYESKLSRENETDSCRKLGSSSLDKKCLSEQNICLGSNVRFVQCMKKETPHCNYAPTALDINKCKDDVLKQYPYVRIESSIPEKYDANVVSALANELVLTSADNLAEYVKKEK